MTWKMFLPIGIIVAILVAIVLYFQVSLTTPFFDTDDARDSSNTDQAIDSILNAMNNEQTALEEGDEDSDVSLISTDSQEISDFGKSYDESEF